MYLHNEVASSVVTMALLIKGTGSSPAGWGSESHLGCEDKQKSPLLKVTCKHEIC